MYSRDITSRMAPIFKSDNGSWNTLRRASIAKGYTRLMQWTSKNKTYKTCKRRTTLGLKINHPTWVSICAIERLRKAAGLLAIDVRRVCKNPVALSSASKHNESVSGIARRLRETRKLTNRNCRGLDNGFRGTDSCGHCNKLLTLSCAYCCYVRKRFYLIPLRTENQRRCGRCTFANRVSD